MKNCALIWIRLAGRFLTLYRVQSVDRYLILGVNGAHRCDCFTLFVFNSFKFVIIGPLGPLFWLTFTFLILRRIISVIGQVLPTFSLRSDIFLAFIYRGTLLYGLVWSTLNVPLGSYYGGFLLCNLTFFFTALRTSSSRGRMTRIVSIFGVSIRLFTHSICYFK